MGRSHLVTSQAYEVASRKLRDSTGMATLLPESSSLNHSTRHVDIDGDASRPKVLFGAATLDLLDRFLLGSPAFHNQAVGNMVLGLSAIFICGFIRVRFPFLCLSNWAAKCFPVLVRRCRTSGSRWFRHDSGADVL